LCHMTPSHDMRHKIPKKPPAKVGGGLICKSCWEVWQFWVVEGEQIGIEIIGEKDRA
jgi:hypothetical protein